MKKVDLTEEEFRSEYRREDLGKGVRGKYYETYIKEVKEELPKRPGGSPPLGSGAKRLDKFAFLTLGAQGRRTGDREDSQNARKGRN